MVTLKVEILGLSPSSQEGTVTITSGSRQWVRSVPSTGLLSFDLALGTYNVIYQAPTGFMVTSAVEVIRRKNRIIAIIDLMVTWVKGLFI